MIFKRFALLIIVVATALFAQQKPLLTLDEFFNSVAFDDVQISPDGRAVVIATERPDWDQEIYRKDLWLCRDDGRAITQLTQSGHDSEAQWSPDGRWIAFLSDRKTPGKEAASAEKSEKKEETPQQLYLISPDGGEAFPATTGDEEVHAFAWSADAQSLFFATRTPLTKALREAEKKEWHDVNRYRDGERGDTIFSISVAEALARRAADGIKPAGDDEPGSTPGARNLAGAAYRVHHMTASPNGAMLAFVTESISQRSEKIEEFEIHLVDLAQASPQSPRRLTHNQAQEEELRWSPDSRQIFFWVNLGSVEGPYKDWQNRVYSVDAASGKTTRWAAEFNGSLSRYELDSTGALLVPGMLGTEIQLYSQKNAGAHFTKLAGWPGWYERVSPAPRGQRIAFIYSSLEKPAEVYLADGPDKLQSARPITSFNKLFTERELPKGKPYRWQADDGTTVEGMLIYPPGKFEAKHLRMFTFIHGGPADADGNHFEADWYQYAILAACNGWLVFEPNYRGSTGYGDRFLSGIVPEIVSRPGRDILEGVDALVRDGIADPDHLVVGGYSYGGYMTNWLITQTTRFKAAVTGAGAVEHAANWGNDDTTLDDAYFLGGTPWEAGQRYHDEAALFQINKVKTPTHMVAGADDIRVAVLEDYLLDHALHNLGVPSTLLIFPGEGHSLAKNPWHGKIKVREELKWLEKWGK